MSIVFQTKNLQIIFSVLIYQIYYCMAKKNRTLVLLTNEESGYSYVRWVDPRKNQTKLAFKKFDPYLRKHALFKQKKLVNS